jgi:hypothetical protein
LLRFLRQAEQTGSVRPGNEVIPVRGDFIELYNGVSAKRKGRRGEGLLDHLACGAVLRAWATAEASQPTPDIHGPS